MENLIQEAAKVIRNILYINIASVTPSGKPWNTPVYCAFDKQLNFYWLSWRQNQHSKNIRSNSSVFVTIYDSTVAASTGFGVYFEGNAYELTNPKDIILGLKAVYAREKRKPRDVIQFLKKFPRRAYKFVPEKIWVNGDGEINGNYIDMRTELDLEKLRSVMK
ncbi:MAG: Pyridoxamine 5'-phosphate oxidase-related FMN-binding protein [Candidatus Gottesmanbacteria bacterium GW2011_GWB1_43_11]|uniref:Pyridoxamine 5'-phosphate oxidase-related FMN-binding protein n=1 Tax=Candidatus Gottesmanbacteria bacterium GW2011_GWB1_43_11 TaxID=1618446 RepID=A0A0G1FL55_9BACT|nr:MAG: Pyridoxamine 5'-phosphate oxidase-related FMN-binding protein [Candidatus Gottesmanbacteria bacterium GW2011_GWA2_42_16]KKS55585.1 MAG: Pyridoxamine 5'-phosphate oxidase-related FMN-binding protein [Candidatus Gottesmanbacteria bacterium GW2011_GWA1_42_26]KKS81551.1 MAG: Pyridoxamine 5'-phosphate oxidase-related FMN-binding protein [Candidatus Gottesmanbacteria bacterium GW2011_GWC1_43_10]KKS87628.1 MAG: Pyridoxamine 5'-phosphate oxidase-related FMN-binding protein [Candidatus Gottesmanb